ncbi:MAG: two-component system sensor histidine kinase NtrB [Planctomycetota bacterium]|jgi:PAS domain S-box-containing protein
MGDWSGSIEHSNVRPSVPAAWLAAAAGAPTGMAVLDRDGRVVLANEAMGGVLGRTPASLAGIDLASLMLGNDREPWVTDLREAVVGRRTLHDRECRFFRPDGLVLWCSLSLAPMELDEDRRPDAPAVVLTAFDITGRKCLEEAFERGQQELRDLIETRTQDLQAANLRLSLADRMAAVGTLGAGLGHDMSNVLMPVRAHLNAVAPVADEAGVGEHVVAIRQSLAYLQQLADGLHFIALDPERENLSDRTTLASWWDEAGPILRKAVPFGVHFECDLPAELPPVRVPPHRLTQAVLNLVVNAGEAIRPASLNDRGELEREKGDGTVRLWASRAPALDPPDDDPEGMPREAIRICVGDDGEGMSPEVARRAGSLYYTTKTRGMGTGLGLALVRKVVDRAHGTLEISSVPGTGTTVTMVLPVADPASAPDPSNDEGDDQ